MRKVAVSEGTEDKEAAIIRTVYGSGYGHAENIVHRLAHLKLRLSHAEAIDILHREVVEEGEV